MATKEERHYFTIPKYIHNNVDGKVKTELVGWGFEVKDKMGRLIAWNTILYKTPKEAQEAAHDRFGEQVPPEHVHDFRVFRGIRTSFGRTAWVREDLVRALNMQTLPSKYVCDTCGEQGYAVKA